MLSTEFDLNVLHSIHLFKHTQIIIESIVGVWVENISRWILVLHRDTDQILGIKDERMSCGPDIHFFFMENRNFGAKVNVIASKQIVRAFQIQHSHRHLWDAFCKPVFIFIFLSITKTGKYFHITSLRSNCLNGVLILRSLLQFHFLFRFDFFSFEIHCTRRLALYYKIKIMLYKNIAASSVMFIRDNGDRMTGERNNAKMKDRSQKNIATIHISST